MHTQYPLYDETPTTPIPYSHNKQVLQQTPKKLPTNTCKQINNHQTKQSLPAD
jgi:hypothetical protein